MTLHLILGDGEGRYALPVATVRHVAPAMAAVPLPRAPAGVEGLACYGGTIVLQVPLWRLTGGEPGAGRMAVVAETGAGHVALRVGAAERVMDLPHEAIRLTGSVGAVRGRVQHGRQAIDVIDLADLALPQAVNLPRAVAVAPTRAAAPPSPRPANESGEVLVCRAGGRLVVFPFDRVASVDESGPAVPRLDLAAALGGEATARAGATVTIVVDGGRLPLGVERIVGLRRLSAITAGREIPLVPNLDKLADTGLQAGLVTEPEFEISHVALRSIALFALTAAGRTALVPRSKVLGVGRVAHWRDMPRRSGRAAGVVALHGDILPAVDLAGLLGADAAPRDMVTAVDAAGTRWCLGCDSVTERHGRIEGGPVTVDGIPLLGEVRAGDAGLPVIDVDRLELAGGLS